MGVYRPYAFKNKIGRELRPNVKALRAFDNANRFTKPAILEEQWVMIRSFKQNFKLKTELIEDPDIEIDQLELMYKAVREKKIVLFKYWRYIDASQLFWIYQLAKCGIFAKELLEKTGIDVNNTDNSFNAYRHGHELCRMARETTKMFKYDDRWDVNTRANKMKKLNKAMWKCWENSRGHLPAGALSECQWEMVYFMVRQDYPVKQMIDFLYYECVKYAKENGLADYGTNGLPTEEEFIFLKAAYDDYGALPSSPKDFFDYIKHNPQVYSSSKAAFVHRGDLSERSKMLEAKINQINDSRIKDICLQMHKHNVKEEKNFFNKLDPSFMQLWKFPIDEALLAQEKKIDIYPYFNELYKLYKKDYGKAGGIQANRQLYLHNMLILGIKEGYENLALNHDELRAKYPDKPEYSIDDFIEECIKEKFGEQN